MGHYPDPPDSSYALIPGITHIRFVYEAGWHFWPPSLGWPNQKRTGLMRHVSPSKLHLLKSSLLHNLGPLLHFLIVIHDKELRKMQKENISHS